MTASFDENMKKTIPIHNRIVITVSYGNYAKGKGGTDKVIKAHQELLNENNISVLHLFRAKTIGEKVKIKRLDIWRVLIDGIDCGMYSTNGFLNYLARLRLQGFRILDVFIHHLNDICIDQLSKILRCIDCNIYFYLHDYFTICPSSGLITDQGVFCGEEKLGNSKCKNCELFSVDAMRRLNEIESFFSTFNKRLTFVAPSEVAKEIWIKSYIQYKDKVVVIYHQKLVGYYQKNKEIISDDQPLNIAFVGYQRPLKGWNIWYDAVANIYKNVNYCFFQFGTVSTHVNYIEEVEVDFTKNLDSMIIQLRNKNIDVAVLWSLLPETYSYTFYEAMAANTFILTNKKSGNIAHQVERLGNGIVADDINDLKKLLMDERNLREKVNFFKCNKKCGPLELKENDALLSLIHDEKSSIISQVSYGILERISVYYYNKLMELYKRIKCK